MHSASGEYRFGHEWRVPHRLGTSMRLKLRALTGSRAGKEFAVTRDRYLIGRSEQCHLRPKSESISRRHCIIAIKDERIVIQDLNSRNGTFVNGKLLPVDRARVLKSGDVVKIGKLEFQAVFESDSREQDRLQEQAAERQYAEVSATPSSDGKSDGEADSRFEDIDISDWLGESGPPSRPREKPVETETTKLNSDAAAQHVEQALADAEKKKSDPRLDKKPGKLPQHLKPGGGADSSTDAANDALRRFFGRK